MWNAEHFRRHRSRFQNHASPRLPKQQQFRDELHEYFYLFRRLQDDEWKWRRTLWWSLDVNGDSIVLQRSRDKDVVENKFGGKERKDIGLLGSNLEGEVSIKINFAILWAINILQKKSQNSIFELPFFTSMTELEHNRDDIIIITSKLEILYWRI